MVKKEHCVVEIQNVKRPIWSSFLQRIFQRIQNCIKNRPWAGRADGVLWKAWKQTQEQMEASPAGGRAVEGWIAHCSCWKSPRGSMGFTSVQRTQDGPLISESLPRKTRPHSTGEHCFNEAHQKEARPSVICRTSYFIKAVASKVVPDEHSCLKHNLWSDSNARS